MYGVVKKKKRKFRNRLKILFYFSKSTLTVVYLVQRNVYFKTPIWTNTRQTEVLQRWKEKEFIEGWGLSCWLCTSVSGREGA